MAKAKRAERVTVTLPSGTQATVSKEQAEKYDQPKKSTRKAASSDEK